MCGLRAAAMIEQAYSVTVILRGIKVFCLLGSADLQDGGQNFIITVTVKSTVA